MKRIGILGGSFNPIHEGHVSLGRESLEAFNLDALIVVPSGNHPFKGEAQVSAWDRLRMTELAFAGDDRIIVSDMEVASGGVNYSIDTLIRLKEHYPEDQLVFIQGADIVYELHRWHRARELHRYCSFAIVTRAGYDVCDLRDRIQWLTGELELQVEFADMELPEVSSTEVRDCLAGGLDCSGLVPEAVLNYIRERGLYT